MKNLTKQLTYDRKLGEMSSIELGIGIIYGCKMFNFNQTLINEIESGITLASVLHSNQVRKSRNEKVNPPYIEHPLRNTLRLIRSGVCEKDILLGCLFHDIVEDCSDIYCELYFNKKPNNIDLAQRKLLDHIRVTYGPKVSFIVKGVTNPQFHGDKSSKNVQYIEHVRNEIKSPEILLVKLSDFIDNAVGLKYSNDELFISKQQIKYYPLFNVFIEELNRQKESGLLPVDNENIDKLIFTLEYGKAEYKMSEI